MDKIAAELERRQIKTPEPKPFKPEAWVRWLEFLERWGYITAGMSFLVTGMVIFIYAWYVFLASVREGVMHAALLLTNELMFVLILLELFRTVINFLRSREIRLEPFLYIGIIAAMRRVLTGGAMLSGLEELSEKLFQRYLWDIGLNIVIVILLVAALFLYSRRTQVSESRP